MMKLKGFLLAAVTTASLLIGAGGASAATSPIEGVWAFSGGKVAVQAQPDGTFLGTVVAPTKFSECFHPVGEAMWTNIREQSDGSYWGFHRWYFANSGCTPNPDPGPTAWRVITEADGSKSLEVCFSMPNSGSQPMIPATGDPSGATYGCRVSARISSVPPVVQAEAGKYILIPGNGLCLTRKQLKIRLRHPVGDPIVDARVRLRSGKLRRRAKLTRKSNGIVATLNLRGLTRPTFKVTVQVTTVLGRHLKGKRTYRLCSSTRRHKHKHHSHR